MSSGIDRAIEAAGGALALAKLLRVTHQAVYDWRIPVSKLVNPKIAKLIS